MSHIDPLDGAIVCFLNYAAGTCIDLPGGNPASLTPLIGYQFHASGNQQWKIQRADSNTVWPAYKIINVASGTCFDLNGGNPADGTIVVGQVNQANNPNQLWRFVSADPLGRVYMIQSVAGGTYVDLAGGEYTNGTAIRGWEGTIQAKNLAQLWRIVIIN
ncbi:carbohydrate-binding module family 13 protein [Nemania serpens]|nr:carbohydrate-binding module family 13 protein [Nemania serpens]